MTPRYCPACHAPAWPAESSSPLLPHRRGRQECEGSGKQPVTLDVILDAAELLGLGRGCGDSGCEVSPLRSGLRTNGGCRCLEGRFIVTTTDASVAGVVTTWKRYRPRERAAMLAALAAATIALGETT